MERRRQCAKMGLSLDGCRRRNRMKQYDTSCNICGASDFRALALRSDGVQVNACAVCGHGIVDNFVDDVHSFYGDEYFASDGTSNIGYEEYAYTAEQGLAWAAELVPLLRNRGRVLDIGCANGRLLELLGSEYERFGIELNAAMAEEARRKGARIVANDLLDAAALGIYRNFFDVVTAIAVFEHIADFKGAVEAALRVLGPDGLLVFEVPLIRGTDDIWFRSSLEHVHYPTERSLQYLFNNILGLHLTGSVVEVRDYGCIYIGLSSRNSEIARTAGCEFERLTSASLDSLTHRELRFRWFYDLIHAAKATPELLRLSSRIAPPDLNPLILRRVFDLCAYREQQLEIIEPYLREVETARDFQASESTKRDQVIASQHLLLVEAERAGAESAQLASDRSSRIGALETELETITRQVGELQVSLQRGQEARNNLETDLHEKENRLMELQEARNNLETDLHEKENRLMELQLELKRGHEARGFVEAELSERTTQLRALQNSLSWKATKPLRRIAGLLPWWRSPT
jgi:O-antigen biosynthesis protein